MYLAPQNIPRAISVLTRNLAIKLYCKCTVLSAPAVKYLSEGLFKENALAGQEVQVGGHHVRFSIATQLRSQVVGDEEEDVGFFRRRRRHPRCQRIGVGGGVCGMRGMVVMYLTFSVF